MDFKRGVEQKYSAWVNNAASRSHELLNKNLSSRPRPYKLLVREALEVPQTTQAIEISLSHPPKLDVKTLLLETPLTLNTGHREIHLEMARKLFH